MKKLATIVILALAASSAFGAQRLPSPVTIFCDGLPSTLGLQSTFTLDSYRTTRIEDGMILDFVALNNYNGVPSEWQVTVSPGHAANWPFGNDVIRTCH
jgi:hypothetical protein